MELNKEAMEFLAGRLAERAPQPVYSTHDKQFFARFSGQGFDIMALPKDVFIRDHVFKTVDGFVDYLNSEHCQGDKGVIFVGDDAAVAQLRYGTPQAHILVCFLALVLWRTLQHWMEGSGLGTAPRKLLEELAEVRSLDVVLPTGTGTELRLRTVSRPEAQLAILLQRLGLVLPGRPKQIQNVVEKIAAKNETSQQRGDSFL